MPSNPLLVIMGPTASGKTQLSLKLARQFNGEIISADSRQIYFGMNIGTDKIVSRKKMADSPLGPIEYNSIPHYLIDTITPDQPYSAADFVNDATKIVAQIHNNKHLPIVIGGTGFYIRALTEKQNFVSVPPNLEFREWANNQPVEKLAEDLVKKDPVLATRVDLKNPRRVIRALEIASAGIRVKPLRGLTLMPTQNYSTFKLAIRRQPDNLRELITKRVDKQLEQGLVEEVRELVNKYGEQAPGLQTIAYRELFPYLRGEETLETARQKAVNANWQYAKRQLTWLRKEPHLIWIDNEDEAFNQVENWIKGMNDDL